VPAPADDPREVSRRTALGLLLSTSAVVSGCTPRGLDRRPRSRPAAAASTATGDPDVALAATVLRAEQAMLDRLAVAVHHHPDLVPELAPVQAVHRAHVRLLTDAVPDHARPAPTPTASATASASPRIPGRPAAALAFLGRAEERLILVDKRNAFAAESGAFARVLAGMAAAAAQQAVVLRRSAAVRA
jgi:hypothetical protein